jgi:hypothetical protein
VPDNNLADGADFTSAFYNTNIREQVNVTCTAATRPSHVDGRRIFETDTNKKYISDGSTWHLDGGSNWTTYTPSWTNLTVGNGVTAAQYRYVPGGIWVKGRLTFGTTTSITGNPSQTIPNSETSSASSGNSLGVALFNDSGTRIFIGAIDCAASSTTFTFNHTESGNSGGVNATNPMTWVTGDIIYWDVTIAL